MRFDARVAARHVAEHYQEEAIEGMPVAGILELIGHRELGVSLTRELAWNDWCNKPGVDIWARAGDDALKTSVKEGMALQYEFSLLWRAYVRSKFVAMADEELETGDWVETLRGRRNCCCVGTGGTKLDASQRQVLAACVSFLRVPMATYNGPKPGVYGLQFLLPRLQLVAEGPGLVACAKLAAKIVDNEDF